MKILDTVGNVGGVYCIECLANKKVYIGSSVVLKKRWDTHYNMLKGNRHHTEDLQEAWNKFGSDNFILFLLEYCDDEICRIREQCWMDEIIYARCFINSKGKDERFKRYGMNTNAKASGYYSPEGRMHTEEQNLKKSIIMQQAWKDNPEYICKEARISQSKKMKNDPNSIAVWNQKNQDYRKSKEFKAIMQDHALNNPNHINQKRPIHPILAYNRFTGEFIGEYQRIIDIANELRTDDSNVSKAINGPNQFIHHMALRLKESDNYPLKIEPVNIYTEIEIREMNLKKIHAKKCVPVVQLDLQSNFIKEYQSAAHAGRELDIWAPTIREVANGKYKSYNGFIFVYKKNYPIFANKN